MKRSEKVEFTASRFAALVGCDRHELIRRLAEGNARPTSETGRGNEYSLRDLHNAAVGGDIQAERLRKVRAEADHLEMSLKVKRRDLVPAAEAVDLVTKCGWDIRQKILALPLPADDIDRLLGSMQKLRGIWQDRAGGETEPSQN